MSEGVRAVAGGRSAAGRPVCLLVSPSLAGHRVIYCRVLTDILQERGFDVAVAGAPRRDREDPLLDGLVARRGVTLHDVAGQLEGRTLPLPAVAGLAARAGSRVTILCEADDLVLDLAAAKPSDRPQGRLVGIFVRSTNAQYAACSVLGGVRSRLGRGARRRAREAAAGRAFAAARLTDVSLVLDERFAAAHPGHCWLPDIYREVRPPTLAEAAETASWRRRLHAFLAVAPRGPVLAYVGTSQHRRGYDTVLRLACDLGGVLVHCGRFSPSGEPWGDDVERLRAVLEERGALFETGERYLSADTASLFLAAAPVVVLPYREHDGSSGVMLQALATGRPVLVPDRGLMAHRVGTFGLGATYRHGDDDDLARRYIEACAERPGQATARIAAFMTWFSYEQLAAAVSGAVVGGPGARLPEPLPPGGRRAAGDGG